MANSLNQDQFPSPADVPPEFGTTPVPQGMVRFHHYTRSTENLPSIMSHGLQERYARESYARGATESPETFATAGAPSEDFKRTHAYVEGWADPSYRGQLSIGENYGGWDPAEHAKRLESHHSTVTFRGDVPAIQMVAAHQPWHSTFRYIQGSPTMERGIMGGEFEDIDEETDKAIAASKVALISKVMLGGVLSGRKGDT